MSTTTTTAAPRRPRVTQAQGEATHGLTEKGHVVELPRSTSDEKHDPLHLVTGIGWADWRPAPREG